MEKNKLSSLVTLIVTLTLCVVVLGMVGTMMAGMFDSDVSNDKILKLLLQHFKLLLVDLQA